MPWIASFLLLWGTYLLGNKSRSAFLYIISGEMLWMIIGLYRHEPDLACICFIFAGMALLNYIKWKPEILMNQLDGLDQAISKSLKKYGYSQTCKLHTNAVICNCKCHRINTERYSHDGQCCTSKCCLCNQYVKYYDIG